MQMLENVGKKTNRKALAEMRKGAQQIKELSKNYAPVDEGNLEAAHKVMEDRQGLNNRVRIYVYIDESMAGTGKNKTVGDYATVMHEGTYDLGPLSRAKMSATGYVGRKYLEKASEELEPQIVKHINAAMRDL